MSCDIMGVSGYTIVEEQFARVAGDELLAFFLSCRNQWLLVQPVELCDPSLIGGFQSTVGGLQWNINSAIY